MPFCSLIYDNIVLVSRALRNQFIIPDWESFTATIRGFYDKVKAMDSVGHVSTLTATERQRETQSPNQPTSPATPPLPSESRPTARVGFGLVSGTFCFSPYTLST